MIRIFAVLVSYLAGDDKGTARCSATCPTCHETCIAGVHPDQTHFCAQGHTWGMAK
jgi:hypothetical protein